MERYFYPKTIKTKKDNILDVKKESKRNFHFWIGLNFLFGFVFAPLSQGFAYYLFFYVLWEGKFAYDINYEYDTQIAGSRAAMIVAGISGFFLGRFVFSRDIRPYRLNYPNHMKYSTLWSIFTGMGGE